MRARTLLLCGLLLLPGLIYANVTKEAVMSATVWSELIEVKLLDNGAPYNCLLAKVRVVLDKSLNGTYVSVVNPRLVTYDHVLARDVDEMTIYVRTLKLKQTWEWVINSQKQKLEPHDVTPTRIK